MGAWGSMGHCFSGRSSRSRQKAGKAAALTELTVRPVVWATNSSGNMPGNPSAGGRGGQRQRAPWSQHRARCGPLGGASSPAGARLSLSDAVTFSIGRCGQRSSSPGGWLATTERARECSTRRPLQGAAAPRAASGRSGAQSGQQPCGACHGPRDRMPRRRDGRHGQAAAWQPGRCELQL